MPTTIQSERPDTPDAMRLVTELEAVLESLYPDESRHGFDVNKLLREDVAFFVVRHDGEAAGCGGVKLFAATDADSAFGEIKRMYIRPPFRGLGLAKMLLRHLEEYTAQHGALLLRLETGIYQTEAIGLYEHWGFTCIPPFGEYTDDPLCICYEKRIGISRL